MTAQQSALPLGRTLLCLLALPLGLAAQTAAPVQPSRETPSTKPLPKGPEVAASADSPAAKADDEVYHLSPFTVSSSAEEGYLATQSLSGTRMRSDLRDVGSAVTVFTEQMLQDLGANSLMSIVQFAPNADPFLITSDDITGTGNSAINEANKIVMRGGATTVVSQDFFASNVPNDRFSTEALTFSRGPNAILFGLGNAAGAFLSSTKRAKFKQATALDYQVDDRGTYRFTLDHNQPIVPKVLAIRFAALYENANNFRSPTESLQRRQFGTLTFTPFKKTTIRVNYERGDVELPALRPWPAYDAYSPWVKAGSPIIPTFTNVATGKPAGTENNAFTGVTSTQLSPAGTQVPGMRWTNSGQSALPSYATGFPVVGAGFRSLVDPAIYPTVVSNHGNTSFQIHDYRQKSAFVEQQIGDNFFVELAYNQLDNRITRINGLVGQSDFIFVDPNAKLPNGANNPNVGMLYTQGGSTRLDNPTAADNYRASASYDLDLTQRKNWVRHLGRHQVVAFGEYSNSRSWSSNNQAYNASGLTPSLAFNNAQNVLQFRYYFDPSKGLVGTRAGDFLRSMPVLYAGDPVPAADPSGITPVFLAQQGPIGSETKLDTRAVALQSFFWGKRIVLINGWRKDTQTNWSMVPADVAALRDPITAAAPRPDGIDVSSFVPNNKTERGGSTSTHGIVFHVLPWMSLSYNISNNFQVNAGTLNQFGDLLPNPRGEGKDASLRFNLLQNRVFIDLTYYTNEVKNAAENVQNTPAGNFSNYDAVWTAIAQFTGDNKYRSFPYSNVATTESDIVGTKSTGWEASVTTNLTPEWRFTINGYTKTESLTTDRGYYTFQYFDDFFLPTIKAQPAWQGLTVTGANKSVALVVADIEQTLANLRALKSVPAGNFSSKWGVNMITSYNLRRIHALKGVTVGLNMNMRGKAVNGYAVDAKGLLDPAKPYYAPSYAVFGAMASYQRNIFHNRLTWQVQLNVRNLFDRYTLYPLRAVDRLDGTGLPAVALYTLREPRTFLLTNSIKF